MLCENVVSREDGTVNIVGACRNLIDLSESSTNIFNTTIFLRFICNPDDSGEHTLSFHLIDSDGKNVIGSPISEKVEVSPNQYHTYYRPLNMTVSKAGHYSLDLYYDDKFVVSHPLYLKLQTTDQTS